MTLRLGWVARREQLHVNGRILVVIGVWRTPCGRTKGLGEMLGHKGKMLGDGRDGGKRGGRAALGKSCRPT